MKVRPVIPTGEEPRCNPPLLDGSVPLKLLARFGPEQLARLGATQPLVLVLEKADPNQVATMTLPSIEVLSPVISDSKPVALRTLFGIADL